MRGAACRGIGRLVGFGALLALASCGAGFDGPRQDTELVLRATLMTLAACTQPLDRDGNVSEVRLAAFGWTPRSRRVSAIVRRGDTVTSEDRPLSPRQPGRLRTVEETEYSEWAHPGWEGLIYLTRQGGAVSERMMGQCAASYFGRDAATADQALAAMTQRLGPPIGRGERPRGGDFLTPRWFEPTVHDVYWRLPFHDVYWVSSNRHMVTVEVRAMPDRDRLDEFSRDRPREELLMNGSVS
ncbi:MAG: hypothetical protein AB7O91_00580 [Sphingomonas sp.]